MKFTKGFWLVRDEFKPDYVRDFYTVEETASWVRAYAPYSKINWRGDTLNVGMMTFTVTAPMPDVLGIRMTNHAGGYERGPAFALQGEIGKKAALETFEKDGKKGWGVTSGALRMELRQGCPEIRFTADGHFLTESKAKTVGMMHEAGGRNYLVAGLNLKAVYFHGGDFKRRVVPHGQRLCLLEP